MNSELLICLLKFTECFPDYFSALSRTLLRFFWTTFVETAVYKHTYSIIHTIKIIHTFTPFHDWLAKLAPLPQPIRNKTKTNIETCSYSFLYSWLWLHVLFPFKFLIVSVRSCYDWILCKTYSKTQTRQWCLCHSSHPAFVFAFREF